MVLPQLACQDGTLLVVGREDFRVEQARQILHVDDLCNECGNCATFCVHQGKPYLDKPRLFLNEEDFEREEDNAFLVQGHLIRRREGGVESRLSVQGEHLTFENAQVRLDLDEEFEVRASVVKERFGGLLSLRAAAEMVTLLNGVRASLPFLLAAHSKD
jgi:putative selenate reductase